MSETEGEWADVLHKSQETTPNLKKLIIFNVFFVDLKWSTNSIDLIVSYIPYYMFIPSHDQERERRIHISYLLSHHTNNIKNVLSRFV